MKIKVKISALEWDGSVLQEYFKSLMYADCSSCGDPRKDKLIDKLNFNNCVRLRRKTTRKIFVIITYKKRKLIIHQ